MSFNGTATWAGEVQVIGPVAVRLPDRSLTVGGRLGLLLCTLVSASPETLSADRLLDELWPDGEGRLGALHTAVSRLRSRLGDADGTVIVRDDLGYRCALSHGNCDLAQFRSSWSAALDARSRQDWSAVTDHVEAALSRVRGDPMAGMDTMRLRVEIATIERQRTELVEAGADAAIEIGTPALWLTRLTELLRDEPTRESTCVRLVRCHHREGNVVKALRVLNTTRHELARAGLEPSAELVELERRVVAATEDRYSTNEQVERPAPSLDASSAAQALAAVDTAIDEELGPCSREVLHDTRRQIEQLISDAEHDDSLAPWRARAWTIVGRIAERCDEPYRLRHAAISALRTALDQRDVEAVLTAGALSMLAVWPSEPNAGIIDVIDRARIGNDRDLDWTGDGRIPAALYAIEALHTSSLNDTAAGDRASVLANEARRLATRTGCARTQALVLDAWLIVHEGHPAIEQVLAASMELLESPAPPTLRARRHVARARVLLRSGQREAVERDIADAHALADQTGDTRCLSRVHQIRAVLAMMSNDPAAASMEIERGAIGLASWPIEQEIAMVQRWWLELDGDPANVRVAVDLAASYEFRAAHHLLIAYTRVRLGQLDDARVHFESVWVGDEFTVPHDSTLPIALVGAVQVAAYFGDRARLAVAHRLLLRYSGQIVVAGDSIFSPGSADRFIDYAESGLTGACSKRPHPRRAAAERLERSIGGQDFVDLCDARMLDIRGLAGRTPAA